MAKLNKMRKLVQFIYDDYEKELGDDFMVGFCEGDMYLMYKTEKELVDEYIKYSKMRSPEITLIFQSAKAHDFLVEP